MPLRVGDLERIGGGDSLPIWRLPLSEEPRREWRRQLLEWIRGDGLFADRRVSLEVCAIVFEMEGSAAVLALEKLDHWIARANGSTSPTPTGHVAPRPSEQTILVVDDQPDIGPLAEDILEPAGYAVVHTTDPLEAIRWARQRTEPIDLLLVDVIMPLMGGRELARRLLELQPRMNVVLMSGYEVAGLRGTGWPFLEKPFSLESLRQIVD